MISVLLVLGLAFSLIGSVSAVESDEDSCEIETFSYERDGNAYLLETRGYDHYSVAKLYKNGVLIQKSIADSATDKVDTEIYESDGTIKNTQSRRISSFVEPKAHAAIEDNENPTSLVMAEPRYREPSAYDEPVDNTDLYISMSRNGLVYYMLGPGTDSFAPDIVATLHRAYTLTYDGLTKHYYWDKGEAISVISSVVKLLSGDLISAVLSLLEFTADEVLEYATAVEVETCTFDYSYLGTVEGQVYYSANRNITYWHVYNATDDEFAWQHKRYNYGFGGSNQDMIRATVEAFFASF